MNCLLRLMPASEHIIIESDRPGSRVLMVKTARHDQTEM